MDGTKITEKEMTARLEELEKVGEVSVAGEANIADDVIASIAGIAAKEVEGVASLGASSIRRALAERFGAAEKRARGVEVEAGKKEAIVDLTVNVIYGYNIPTIIVGLRRNVATRLLELCGLVAKEINIKIVGIEFPEKTPAIKVQ